MALVGWLCRFLDVDQSAAPLTRSSQSSRLSMGTPVATVTAKGGCGDHSCVNSAYCVVCFCFGARRWNAKPRTPVASGQKTKSARHCWDDRWRCKFWPHRSCNALDENFDPLRHSETVKSVLWTGRLVYASIGPHGTRCAGSAPSMTPEAGR